jgi:hypothetical protein
VSFVRNRPKQGCEADGRCSAQKEFSSVHLLTRLWNALQNATGAPDDQIVIGIQEVPPSQAMEMGHVMPDVT